MLYSGWQIESIPSHIPRNPLLRRILETTKKDSGKVRNQPVDAAIDYSNANILFD
jgi:hypothetical protein